MIKTLRQLKNGFQVNAIKRKFSAAYNQPMSGNDMPRAGGIATFMRLPHYASAKGMINSLFFI